MCVERNVIRWWIYKLNGDTCRTWTDAEYNTIEPHKHIFEKRWLVFYPNWTGRLPLICRTQKEAKQTAKRYEDCNLNLPHHKTYIEYVDCELLCVEFKEVLCEGAWVTKRIQYD